MNRPQFLITRFSRGCAGKFLSTVLQTSSRVDHWSVVLQQNKKDSDLFRRLTVEYVKRSFPTDYTQHLKLEPMVPYSTELYSTGLPRGNDVTLDQYLFNAIAQRDHRLIDAVGNSQYINLVFNKPKIPNFCDHNRVVTVLIDTPEANTWLNQTLWNKHFIETDQYIRHVPDDPENCHINSLVSVLKYNNQYEFDVADKDMLFDRYVLNDPNRAWFDCEQKFEEFDQQHNLNNVFIPLSSFFDPMLFIKHINSIFDCFDLGTADHQLIQTIHQIWLSRQIAYERN